MPGGPRTGTRSGSAPQYNPATNKPWRPGGTFAPENAAKLFAAMQALGCSASGVLNELVARMPVDEKGCPVWASEPVSHVQPALLPEPAPDETAARRTKKNRAAATGKNRKLAA